MAKLDDADRMRLLLIESITTLCRSGIHYSESLKVEGLLAITIDEGDVMVVNVNKVFEADGAKNSTEDSCVSSDPSKSIISSNNGHQYSDTFSLSSRKRTAKDEQCFKSEKKKRNNVNLCQDEESCMSPGHQCHNKNSQQNFNTQTFDQIDETDVKPDTLVLEIEDSEDGEYEPNYSFYSDKNINTKQQERLQAACASGTGASSRITCTSSLVEQQVQSSSWFPHTTKKPWKVDHNEICKCCGVLKKKKDLAHLYNRCQTRDEWKKERDFYISQNGPMEYYKVPSNHMDLCECCVALKEIRRKEKLKRDRFKSKKVCQ